MSLETELCGCKGARVCAVCENSDRAKNLQRLNTGPSLETFKTYLFCSRDALGHEISAGSTYDLEELFTIHSRLCQETENGLDSTMICDKIVLVENFISEQEELDLVKKIDSQPWLLSQSGRRKQDYGPRVNFKQQKLKSDSYIGMPHYSQTLLQKMQKNDGLRDYVPFELCNLEYIAERGSSIDFHVDDTWIWGERLISLNLLESSVMTLINEKDRIVLYIPMPRRSLLCISGEMRYKWNHGIFRWHIVNRRIALTMREAADKFRPGGELYEKYGKELIEKAHNFIEL